MESNSLGLIIVLVVLAIFVIVVLLRSVRIVPQARAGIVERLGKYNRTLNPGLTILIPLLTDCCRCWICVNRLSPSRPSR